MEWIVIDKVRAGYRPEFWHAFVNPSWIARRALFVELNRMSDEVDGCVLDFGCGRKPYRSIFTNVEDYIGIDTDISGHDHSNSVADIFYDGSKMPFESAAFDGVFSSQVLEHVRDLDLTFSELSRVLKVGGKLLLSIPFVWNEHEQPYDFRRFTEYGIAEMLERYGFSVEVIRKTGSGPEVVAQMLTVWVSQSLLRSNKILVYFCTFFFFSLIHIFARFIGALCPDDRTMYLDLVVLASKQRDYLGEGGSSE